MFTVQVRVNTRNCFIPSSIAKIRQGTKSSIDQDVGRQELWSVDCVGIPETLVKFRACALWLATHLQLSASEKSLMALLGDMHKEVICLLIYDGMKWGQLGVHYMVLEIK